MSKSEKTIVLHSTWKAFSLSYLIGFLLIPVLGAGLYIIWKTFKKHSSRLYKISDTHITAADGKYSQKIDLINIASVEVSRSGFDRFFNTGTLHIKAAVSEIELMGIEHPEKLKEAIETAVQALIDQRAKEKQPKPREASYDAGSMDRLDYLTGLWQQGLIDDEEFDRERKHFE